MATRLGLTRDQLASFLQDHEQIKQFERLFSDVQQLEPTTLVDLAINVENADQKAVEALDSIAALAQQAAVCCAVTDVKANEALTRIQTLAQETAVNISSAENKASDALDKIASLAQDVAVGIASAENKAQQALEAISQLAPLVNLVAMAPPEREYKRSRYGSFYDTTTQTATTINTAKAITYNTTDISYGVYIGSPASRVYVDTEGIYNFQTSVQLDSTVATDEEFYLWFRVNGVDVTNSASQARVKGNNAEVFLSLNFFFNLKAGDYVELMFSVTNLGVQLLASGAVAPHPGIPSIILTVANNINGIQ